MSKSFKIGEQLPLLPTIARIVKCVKYCQELLYWHRNCPCHCLCLCLCLFVGLVILSSCLLITMIKYLTQVSWYSLWQPKSSCSVMLMLSLIGCFLKRPPAASSCATLRAKNCFNFFFCYLHHQCLHFTSLHGGHDDHVEHRLDLDCLHRQESVMRTPEVAASTAQVSLLWYCIVCHGIASTAQAFYAASLRHKWKARPCPGLLWSGGRTLSLSLSLSLSLCPGVLWFGGRTGGDSVDNDLPPRVRGTLQPW